VTTAANAPLARRPQGGPPLIAPVLAYGALMIAAVILSAASPQPSASPAAVLAYDSAHHDALQVAGCLGSALGLPGLVSWTSSQSVTSGDPAVARALEGLSFAAGSAGFVAPLGLLIAGIAVPGLILRLLPRPLAWAGLMIAAASEISAFALLTPALDFAFPVGRFLGLAWLVAASVTLPASRPRADRAPAPAPFGPGPTEETSR
jgi:hypothetical protein